MQIGSLHDRVTVPTMVVMGCCLVVFGGFLWFKVSEIGQDIVFAQEYQLSE